MKRFLRLHISTSVILNRPPLHLFARLLQLLPRDTRIVGINEYADQDPFDPFNTYRGSPMIQGDGVQFKLESQEFDEVQEGCQIPELQAHFDVPAGVDATEAQITLTIHGRTPAWLKMKAPDGPTEAVLKMDREREEAYRRRFFGEFVDQTPAAPEPHVCQCDVAYIGGHWSHCQVRKKSR